jgi:uncharacterized protein (TIGR03437 family)
MKSGLFLLLSVSSLSAAVSQPLPFAFEPNQGQSHPQVRFLSRGQGYTLFLTGREAVLRLPEAVLRMRFAGARRGAVLLGQEPTGGVSHYLRGRDQRRWRTGIPHHGAVRYRELWSGIDLVFYGNQGRLEFDFVVSPGADPSAIRLAFDGPKELRIDDAGDLVLGLPGGEIRQQRPVVYQEIAGVRRPVHGRFVMAGRKEVGFAVAAYDRARPLVIDPVLVYSTYLGGGRDDAGNAVAVDAEGNAYVTGRTASTDFPTARPARPSSGGQEDAFVAKLNAAGSALVYATYLGGRENESGRGIAVDRAGNAYVAGSTTSPDFPTVGAFQSQTRVTDAFIAKLNPAGSSLIYSTLLGGDQGDWANALAIDGAGAAYITGETNSSDFPRRNASQPNPGGGTCRFGDVGVILTFPCGDAFVAKLSPAGNALEYSTYLGGRNAGFAGSGGDLGGEDYGGGIALDSAGNAYVTGRTMSAAFPTTPGALRTTATPNDAPLAFVAKYNPSGQVVYSTYLGPGEGKGIAADASGSAYVTGSTASAAFPTASPYQRTLAGRADAFICKLNAAGSGLVYSTYLGGSDEDSGNAIALDGSGAAYVAGGACSANFPTQDPMQGYGGACDAFVAKVSASGEALVYSTFLGGSGVDGANGVAADSSGNAWVTGRTVSDNFPTATFRAQRAGGADAFVTRLGDRPSTPTVTVVSAASFRGPSVAPESIAAAFGQGLATTTEVATTRPLPTTLGGTSLRITDSAGAEFVADLFFVSPGQINFYIPRGVAPGRATITVTTGAGTTITGTVQIEPVAPSLFTANASGRGVAAALAIRARGDGSQSPVDVFRFDPVQRQSIAVPIDLGPPDDQIVLILFGTGIRGNSGLGNVRARAAGVDLEVLYAGAQGDFVGLDQVNLRLARALAGRGEITIDLTVDGRAANPVTVSTGGAPRITSLSPASAEAGQTIASFTITGENLGGVNAIEFAPSTGITVSDVQAQAGMVTGRVTIASNAAPGERSVVVASPSGRSNALTFVITQPVMATPRITSLNPSAGDQGQTINNFTISGENLSGVTALDFAPADGITVTNLQASATSVTARVAVAGNASTGPRAVSVVSAGGRSNSLSFTVRRPVGGGEPRIASVNPTTADAGQTIASFTITGENLAGVTAIEFTPPDGITVSNIQATAGTVTATVVIASGAVAGNRTVAVRSAAGLSNALPFTIRGASATGPQIFSLTPNLAAVASTVNLVISGEGLAGVTAVEITPPEGVTVAAIVQTTATSVTARVVVAATAPQTDRTVVVVAGTQRSNGLAFSIRQTVPRVPVISNGTLAASILPNNTDVNARGGFDFTDGDGDIRQGLNFPESAQLRVEFTSRGASCSVNIRGAFLHRPGVTSGRVTFNMTFIRPQSIIQGDNPVVVSLIDAAGRESNRLEFRPQVWACGLGRITFSE